MLKLNTCKKKTLILLDYLRNLVDKVRAHEQITFNVKSQLLVHQWRRHDLFA